MENTQYNERYFVGVRFETGGKTYFFATDYDDLKSGDLVVAETVNGDSIGMVSTTLYPIANYRGQTELRKILRRPNRVDLTEFKESLERSKNALKVASEGIVKFGLPMRLFEATYSLDGDHCTISFFSESRVDFRDLLKYLAAELHCHIILKQIPPRDKAKMIGGIGICGLPLCCSTFLKEFDGISIARAKNQMLTLNIPKLSGPCTKLICCLLYEDEAYTEGKRLFPPVGSRIRIDGDEYVVSSFNILSKTIRVVRENDSKNLSLEEYNAYAAGKVPPKKDKEADLLPDFGSVGGIPESKFVNELKVEAFSKNNQKQGNQNNNNQRDRRQNRPQNGGQNNNNRQNRPNNQNNGNHPQNGNQNQGNRPQNNNQGNRPQNGNQNHNGNRRRHRHRPRGNRPNNNGGEA